MNLRSFFHLLGSLSVYIFALVLGLGLTYYTINSFLFSPVNANSTEEVGFVVERGANLKQVAEKLETLKLVKSALGVEILSRLKFEDQRNKIIAGEYKLSPSMTPRRILEVILSGEVVYYQVTIPPGVEVAKLPKLFAETTLVTAEELQQALKDPALLKELSIPGNSMEGYIFPETYKFSRPIDSKEIITRLVTEGRKKFTNEMLERTAALGYNVHQILTLASVIEKETGHEPDRKNVASVFHNRLKLGMPLQSDPTVIYAVPNFDGNLTRVHLKTPSPFNTYLNTGLPPSPITNPSLASIEAALNPNETDFLYFVGKGDGTSQFSANLRDHNEAVRKYQLGKAPLIEPEVTAPKTEATEKEGAKNKGGDKTQPIKAPTKPKGEVLELDDIEKLRKADPPPAPRKPAKPLSQLDPIRRLPSRESGTAPGAGATPEDVERLLRDSE